MATDAEIEQMLQAQEAATRNIEGTGSPRHRTAQRHRVATYAPDELAAEIHGMGPSRLMEHHYDFVPDDTSVLGHAEKERLTSEEGREAARATQTAQEAMYGADDPRTRRTRELFTESLGRDRDIAELASEISREIERQRQEEEDFGPSIRDRMEQEQPITAMVGPSAAQIRMSDPDEEGTPAHSVREGTERAQEAWEQTPEYATPIERLEHMFWEFAPEQGRSDHWAFDEDEVDEDEERIGESRQEIIEERSEEREEGTREEEEQAAREGAFRRNIGQQPIGRTPMDELREEPEAPGRGGHVQGIMDGAAQRMGMEQALVDEFRGSPDIHDVLGDIAIGMAHADTGVDNVTGWMDGLGYAVQARRDRQAQEEEMLRGSAREAMDAMTDEELAKALGLPSAEDVPTEEIMGMIPDDEKELLRDAGFSLGGATAEELSTYVTSLRLAESGRLNPGSLMQENMPENVQKAGQAIQDRLSDHLSNPTIAGLGTSDKNAFEHWQDQMEQARTQGDTDRLGELREQYLQALSRSISEFMQTRHPEDPEAPSEFAAKLVHQDAINYSPGRMQQYLPAHLLGGMVRDQLDTADGARDESDRVAGQAVDEAQEEVRQERDRERRPAETHPLPRRDDEVMVLEELANESAMPDHIREGEALETEPPGRPPSVVGDIGGLREMAAGAYNSVTDLLRDLAQGQDNEDFMEIYREAEETGEPQTFTVDGEQYEVHPAPEPVYHGAGPVGGVSRGAQAIDRMRGGAPSPLRTQRLLGPGRGGGGRSLPPGGDRAALPPGGGGSGQGGAQASLPSRGMMDDPMVQQSMRNLRRSAAGAGGATAASAPRQGLTEEELMAEADPVSGRDWSSRGPLGDADYRQSVIDDLVQSVGPGETLEILDQMPHVSARDFAPELAQHNIEVGR